MKSFKFLKHKIITIEEADLYRNEAEDRLNFGFRVLVVFK
jgi:hypothetical protein